MGDQSTHQGAKFVWRLFCICPWVALYLLTASLLVLPHSAQAANDLISERAWFEDPTGQLDFSQAQKSSAYRPFDALLSAGYGEGVVWIKLTIDPSRLNAPQAIGTEAMLRIQPAYLDEVAIFDPRMGDEPVALLGDRHHPKHVKRLSITFDHAISLESEPFDLYLRVTSTSTRHLFVQALTDADFRQAELLFELGSIFYTVVLLVMLLTALVQWRLSGDALFGYFSLSVASAFFYAWSITGLIRIIWPEAWPVAWMDLYHSTFAITAVTAGILFHFMFLARLGLPRWAWILGGALLIHQLIQFGLLLSGQIILALTLNLADVLMASVLFFLLAIVSAWYRSDQDPMPHWIVVALYGLLLVFMLLAAVPGLGIFKGPEFSLYVVQVNAFMTSLLILLVLQYRQRLINQQRLAFEKKAKASEQAAEKARFARAEQQKLVDMLTHELKVPLAVMRMKIDESDPVRAPLSRAIQDMTTIIERCGEAAKAEEGGLVPHTEWVDCHALIDQVVNSVFDGHKVDWQRSAEPLMIQTDPQLLFVVLMNLIENDCKYSPKDGMVSIWVTSTDDATAWSVSVANPPGDAGWPDPDQLFVKYYRASQARRQSGTGLGLFLAQSLANLLNVHIDYVPEANRVVFRLRPFHPSDSLKES